MVEFVMGILVGHLSYKPMKEKKVFGINSTVDNNLNPMVDPCHGKGTLMNVTFYTEWIQQTLLSLRLRAAGINTIIDTME